MRASSMRWADASTSPGSTRASSNEQARRTGAIPENAPVRLYGAGAIVGASSLEAFHDAQALADAEGGAPS
jgi:hypothetical protein